MKIIAHDCASIYDISDLIKNGPNWSTMFDDDAYESRKDEPTKKHRLPIVDLISLRTQFVCFHDETNDFYEIMFVSHDGTATYLSGHCSTDATCQELTLHVTGTCTVDDAHIYDRCATIMTTPFDYLELDLLID